MSRKFLNSWKELNLFNKLREINGKEPEEGIGERGPEGGLDKGGLRVSRHQKKKRIVRYSVKE